MWGGFWGGGGEKEEIKARKPRQRRKITTGEGCDFSRVSRKTREFEVEKVPLRASPVPRNVARESPIHEENYRFWWPARVFLPNEGGPFSSPETLFGQARIPSEGS